MTKRIPMKVCVYVEYEEHLKKYGDTGIGNSAKMCRAGLEKNGVEVTDDPDDEYDIIDINPVAFFEASKVLKRARKRGKVVVVHAHTTPENFRNSFWFSNCIAPVMERRIVNLYREADGLICVSNHVSDTLDQLGVKNRKHIIGNCFEGGPAGPGDRDACRERYGLEGTVPFSVGLVIPRKGIDTFVNVARRMPEQFAWFGQVGSGAFTSFKGRKVIRDAPNNVSFTGYVDNIKDAYAAGDVLFFPSLNETFGIVILEALYAGKPVLIRDLPVYDWITHGKECLKAGSDDEFGRMLRKLMDDEGLRSRLTSAGKAKAAEYSPMKVGKKLICAYSDFFARANPTTSTFP